VYYMAPLAGLGTAVEVADETLTQNAAIPEDSEQPVVDEIDGPVVREEVTAEQWMLPASLAIQVFSIVPGIAGGVAGFVLAQKLSRAKTVKTTEVMTAAGTVALVTFLAVFLVRTIDEFED